MTTRLLLARHGESVWNRERRVTGQQDPPLSAKGATQAQLLADALADEGLAAIYSSPLRRAAETASVVGERLGLAVESVAALCEMSFGSLEGRFRDERDPETHMWWRRRELDRARFRAPGGEDFAQLTARVAPWVEQVLNRHRGEHVLVVAHRNTNRVVLARALGMPVEQVVDVAIRSSAYFRVDIEDATASEIRFDADPVRRARDVHSETPA